MELTSNPTLAITKAMAMPLRVCCAAGGSPLIHPAGPDCGFMTQAVMIAAATLPTMMASIC